MRSATVPLLRALGARLTAAYAAAGVTCPWSTNPGPVSSMPYGVLGSDTETDVFSTKTTDGGELTHTLRIYSRSMAEARRLADIAIVDITDRDNYLDLEAAHAGDTTSYYQADRTRLEMNEIIPERDEREGDVFGAAIRFRFLIGQR